VSEARVVLTTCPDGPSAESRARVLVDERLAACVNLVPGVRAIYRWRAAIEESDEILMVVKTTAALVPALTKKIEAASTYDVPEVLVVRADGGSPAYLDWIAASVGETAPR
jgi:periplasmic divalent cation tolerance protein